MAVGEVLPAAEQVIREHLVVDLLSPLALLALLMLSALLFSVLVSHVLVLLDPAEQDVLHLLVRLLESLGRTLGNRRVQIQTVVHFSSFVLAHTRLGSSWLFSRLLCGRRDQGFHRLFLDFHLVVLDSSIGQGQWLLVIVVKTQGLFKLVAFAGHGNGCR